METPAPALPPGFMEALDEKTRNLVAIAVLAERQSNHEKFNIERFNSLKSAVDEVKEGLESNTKAQRSYFIWIIGIMLAASGSLAFLYLSGMHHAGA